MKLTFCFPLPLIGTFIGFSWLAMQAVHELGHVLGAITTGGHVTKVVLHPCTISRTDVHPNPHPLFVVWAGPLVGSVLPVLAFLLARALRSPGVFLFRLGAVWLFAITFGWGLVGIWLGTALDWTVRVVGLWYFFKRGAWKKIHQREKREFA